MAVLLVVVIIVVVGAGLLAYRHRPEHSIESGITSFRREMRALAPPGPREPRQSDGHAPPDDPPPPPGHPQSGTDRAPGAG